MSVVLGAGPDFESAIKTVAQTVTDVAWRVKENDKEVNGIEHAGLHMSLKKLLQHDKAIVSDNRDYTFGRALLEVITDETVSRYYLIRSNSCVEKALRMN